MNRHEERRRRKLDRQKRRREGTPQPRMNGNEPCSCGGRFTVKPGSGCDALIAHTKPPCRPFELIETASQLDAYIALQRRANAVVGTVHTVPWFEEIQTEMPGFVIRPLLAFADLAAMLGIARLETYLEAMRAQLGLAEEDAIGIIKLARVLAIVGASEVDADASITSHPPAGVN